MAKEETSIVHNIMIETAPHGARLWKNVRGFFYTLDGVMALLGAIRTANWQSIIKATKGLRKVKAGVGDNGSSDLWGFISTIITPEMVGKTIAVFTVIEAKTPTGKVEPEQESFINFVLKSGGNAGVARSPEDAKKIMHI